MLSVSGARGIVGQSMTPAVAAAFAASFGTQLRKKHGDRDHPLVCLGRDSRQSGQAMAAAVASGLASVGCRVIDLGLVTTPTVGVMIPIRGADGGVVITASHNPIEWNGIKCLDRTGAALPPDDIGQVITRFRTRQINPVLGRDVQPRSTDDSAGQTHVDRVLETVDVQAICAAEISVVLDSINGAGGGVGRMLLEALGCSVLHLNVTPDGCFAHPPEPSRENLVDLAQRTRQAGAMCGFAQDPDADRLAIIDETGAYIGEEYTLVLAAQQVLEDGGAGVMAANLSTSRMIDDLAAKHPGSRVIRTAVGEANVVTGMRDSHATVGGEGNGGVIDPRVGWVRDSLSAMALVLNLLATERRPLSSIIRDSPSYVMIKRKFDVTAVGGGEAIAPILERVATHCTGGEVNTVDGVRIDYADSWVHLRPSNTEPIVRLIAEAPTRDRAEQIMLDVASTAGLVQD